MNKKTSSLNLLLFGRSFLRVDLSRESHCDLEKSTEEAIKRPLEPLPAEDIAEDVPVFVTTSWFLMDCYRHLMKSESEVLHYVTGWTRGNIRSLERLVPVNLSHQSMVGAEADIDSLGACRSSGG